MFGWKAAREAGQAVAVRRPEEDMAMSEPGARYTGGCLFGALRYEADGEPAMVGHCYCADCRKASGSGFIPFMGFPAAAVRFSGQPRMSVSKSARGTDAVRNFCAVCGGLVFGGVID